MINLLQGWIVFVEGTCTLASIVSPSWSFLGLMGVCNMIALRDAITRAYYINLQECDYHFLIWIILIARLEGEGERKEGRLGKIMFAINVTESHSNKLPW